VSENEANDFLNDCPKRNSEFVSLRPSMFPEGKKIHCFPCNDNNKKPAKN